jgi:hypothetical protein
VAKVIRPAGVILAAIAFTTPLWIDTGCGSDSTGSGGGGSGASGGSVAGSSGSAGSGGSTAGSTGGTGGSSNGTAGSVANAGAGGSQASGTGGSSGLSPCNYYAPNGECPTGLKCRCCRTLGAQSCACSTACTTDAECTDPARASCVEKTFGFCAPAADFCTAQ